MPSSLGGLGGRRSGQLEVGHARESARARLASSRWPRGEVDAILGPHGALLQLAEPPEVDGRGAVAARDAPQVAVVDGGAPAERLRGRTRRLDRSRWPGARRCRPVRSAITPVSSSAAITSGSAEGDMRSLPPIRIETRSARSSIAFGTWSATTSRTLRAAHREVGELEFAALDGGCGHRGWRQAVGPAEPGLPGAHDGVAEALGDRITERHITGPPGHETQCSGPAGHGRRAPAGLRAMLPRSSTASHLQAAHTRLLLHL